MAHDFFGHSPSVSEARDPGVRVTLPQIRAFLGRYCWVIAGVFLFTAASAYTALSLMTELYEIRSALLVKLGRENLDGPVTARNGVLSTGVRREELGSEVQILLSRELIEQVVDELGIEAFRVVRVPPTDLLGQVKFYTKAGLRWVKGQAEDLLITLDLKKRLPEREAAIALLAEELSAVPAKETDVVGLSMRLADPTLGKRIQEVLIQKYLVYRVQVRQTRGVREFFSEEVAQLREALRIAEDNVNLWRSERQLTVPAEQKALLLRQVRELAAQREQALSRIEALSGQVNTARRLLLATPEHIRASQIELPSAATQQFRERLTKLEGDRARLLTTYFPDSSPVKAVEEEISSVRQLLASQNGSEVGSVTTDVNPQRQQLEQSINQNTVALEGLRAEFSTHDRHLAGVDRELRRVAADDTTLVTLERDRALAEAEYTNAVKRLNDAEVESELDVSRISNVTVAAPPAASLSPVYPRKILLMALALAIGLVLGIALAIALEWTTDTVRDAEDMEAATDLVCLATFGRQRIAGRG